MPSLEQKLLSTYTVKSLSFYCYKCMLVPNDYIHERKVGTYLSHLNPFIPFPPPLPSSWLTLDSTQYILCSGVKRM